MGTEFRERQRMISRFRMEQGRDPDDAEWLDIYSAVKVGRRSWKWC